MSELQMAMIGFGVLLVGGVVAYNLWQEKRHRRRAEAMLSAQDPSGPDVLMEGRTETSTTLPVRVDPVLGQHATDPDHAPVPPASTFSSGRADVLPTALPPLLEDWMDARTDCVLSIEFPDPVPVAAIIQAQEPWVSALDKPLHWRCLDVASRRWQDLSTQETDASLTHLVVGLQLANRRGAIDATTLTTFLEGIHRMARQLGGLIDLPDVGKVLARAGELDTFCAAVDLQLAVHVIPRRGSLNDMQGAKLKPLIDVMGLHSEAGHYVLRDTAGREVFSLFLQTRNGLPVEQLDSAALTALIFRLDVPRVASGVAGFERMLSCAHRCAATLGGQMVDAHGKPFADDRLAAIRAHIDSLQERMASRDMPAGESRALRLFA